MVYDNGKGKSRRLPYASMKACAKARDKGALAWSLEMTNANPFHGQTFEFHAPTSAARDMWVKAVSSRMEAHKKKSASAKFAATATEAALNEHVNENATPSAGVRAMRTISFGRSKKNKAK